MSLVKELPKRILVVDDDEHVVNFLTMYLKHRGLQPTSALTGADVEKFLETNSCELVILDIRLKDVEGIDLIPKIRTKLPDVPIVILTGMGYDEQLMQKALDKGANGYVSKTLPPEELLAALLRAVNTSHHN